MAELLRRRLRVRALAALASATASPADPLVRGALAAAAGLARWSRHERRALANLELALGSETRAAQRRRIARDVRRHAARQVHEWLVLASAGRSSERARAVRAWIERTVELDASVEDVLRAARARGVLVATAHLGNWELLAAALVQRGVDGTVVGFRKRDDPAADWLVALRAGLGVATLPQDAPPRRALEVLRRGGSLGVLCDLHARRLDGIEVPFFGIPTRTMTAPAALARASRRPLWPLRCVARGRRYRIAADPPLELDPHLPRREAAADLAARLNRVFEAWIRADPGQWAWHQRRWPERVP